MEKNFNFTTAFAMRCDAEQFESVIKELEGMGYEVDSISSDWEKFCYIINNYDNTFGRISNVINSRKNKNNRIVIETFNRDICLALAAMTDKPDGIVGEWFKRAIPDDRVSSLQKKYFMLKERKDGYIVDSNDETHNILNIRKATADELIKYFGESKPEEKPENNPLEALQKRIEDLEYNVKQLAESMQNVRESEPQPSSRFADKQPIWAWDNCWSAKRDARFWDIKNNIPYNLEGKRGGTKFDNYEPIPADQIPAWMIEAAKYLED